MSFRRSEAYESPGTEDFREAPLLFPSDEGALEGWQRHTRLRVDYINLLETE